jgi:hypothetical protein
MLNLLKEFQAISGLKTNVEKTVAYRIGHVDGKDPPENGHALTWKILPISLLGITIANTREDIIKENFTDKLQGI